MFLRRLVALLVACVVVAGCATNVAETATEPAVVAEQVVSPFVDPTTTIVVATTVVEIEPLPVVSDPIRVPVGVPDVEEGTPVLETVAYEGDIPNLICSIFGDECQKALAVVQCESRFNPLTVGGAGERGLFQIHPVHAKNLAAYGLTWDEMFDPVANVTYAFALWSKAGWGPWTCA